MPRFHSAGVSLLAAVLLQFTMVADASAQNQSRLERGRYLMSSVAACGNCHTPRGPDGAPLPDRELSGGPPVKDQPFDAYPSNITPDKETGIGKWTDAQLKKAIREGIRPNGTLIGPPMPFGFYRDMSDDDLNAIVAYLRQVKPVKNVVPKSEYRIPLPPAYGPPIKQPVKAPSPKDQLAYGAYLAGPVAHCVECHTPMGPTGVDRSKMGAGGFSFNGPWGSSVARNLTPHETGLKDWSDAEVDKAVRTGVSRDGSPLKPPMGFGFYKTMSASDMQAIIAYLRSLKPLPLGGGT